MYIWGIRSPFILSWNIVLLFRVINLLPSVMIVGRLSTKWGDQARADEPRTAEDTGFPVDCRVHERVFYGNVSFHVHQHQIDRPSVASTNNLTTILDIRCTVQCSLEMRPCNAWFNFTCYHPPRATPGTSPALRSRGWGIVWSRLVPGGGGRGKSKITVFVKFVTSRSTLDRVEKTAYFQGESLEFVADWLEKNNSQN